MVHFTIIAYLPFLFSFDTIDELHRRPVRIFMPTNSTTQSAKGNSHHWRIDWDILAGGGKWENPLMGWASS